MDMPQKQVFEVEYLDDEGNLHTLEDVPEDAVSPTDFKKSSSLAAEELDKKVNDEVENASIIANLDKKDYANLDELSTKKDNSELKKEKKIFQKMKSVWLKTPAFFPWLEVVTRNGWREQAYCNICQEYFKPSFIILKRHAKSKEHLSAAAKKGIHTKTEKSDFVIPEAAETTLKSRTELWLSQVSSENIPPASILQMIYCFRKIAPNDTWDEILR